MVPKRASFYHLESVNKPDDRFLLAYSDNCDFPRLRLRSLAGQLRSGDVKIRREEVVCKVAMLLIKASTAERRQCLVTLLPDVQVGLWKNSYLRPAVLRKAFVYRHMYSKTIVQHCCRFRKSKRDACPRDLAQRMFVHRARAEVLFVHDRSCDNSNPWGCSTLNPNHTKQAVFRPQCGSGGHKIYATGLAPFHCCIKPSP